MGDGVLFSAKESIYKAWFPIERRWLDHQEADARPERRMVGIADRSLDELAPEDPLGVNLRHQAYSIVGGDTSAYPWLVGASRHEGLARSRPPRYPLWLVDPALATALARQGDRDRLLHFIDRCLTGDDQEHANLRYWACWAGATLSNPALQIFDGGDLSPSVTARFWRGAGVPEPRRPLRRAQRATLRAIIRRPAARRTLAAMPEVCDLLLARGAAAPGRQRAPAEGPRGARRASQRDPHHG